ncbi:biopolymer transporter ExbD [Pyruvatibacter sp.]|uniref:ExbD/TolR family protein n=1 Tax=Pyruvatibacter sp. TaxID=1981328 RepID=UPI0032EB1D90
MMPLRHPRTERRPDGTLPLINIVLLLVLAFMIAGTVDVPLPDQFDPLRVVQAGPETQRADVIDIMVGQNGDVFHLGAVTSDDTLSALFSELGKEDKKLRIKSDSRAPASKVIELLATAEDAGVKTAVIMTIEAQL